MDLDNVYNIAGRQTPLSKLYDFCAEFDTSAWIQNYPTAGEQFVSSCGKQYVFTSRDCGVPPHPIFHVYIDNPHVDNGNFPFGYPDDLVFERVCLNDGGCL